MSLLSQGRAIVEENPMELPLLAFPGPEMVEGHLEQSPGNETRVVTVKLTIDERKPAEEEPAVNHDGRGHLDLPKESLRDRSFPDSRETR